MRCTQVTSDWSPSDKHDLASINRSIKGSLPLRSRYTDEKRKRRHHHLWVLRNSMFCSHWKVANIEDSFRVKFSLRVKCLCIKVKIHRRKTKADAKAVYTNTICVSFCWHLFHTRYPVLDTAIQILQKELWAVLYQVPITLKSFQRLMLPFHSLSKCRLLIKYLISTPTQ